MGEKERVRTRDRGDLEMNNYELSLKDRAEFQKRQLTGQIVIRSTDREWETNRQATVKMYLSPYGYKDTALNHWSVFIHDIRKHSGMHRHQGGLVIFVLEGEGATMVDGETLPWEAGDLILLPIKPKGVEHKHFNRVPGQTCKWMAFIHQPIWDYVASEMVQVELAPEFSAKVTDGEKFIQASAENTTGSQYFKSHGGPIEIPKVKTFIRNGEQLNLYDELMKLRDRQRAFRRTAKWMLRGKELAWENNPHGVMRWYTHPLLEDTVINTLIFYMLEIPPGSRTGRLRHQGDQVSYVLEGKGYMILDGVRHDWQAGDVVTLPLRRDGVTFQQFNADPKQRVRMVCCEPNFVNTCSVDRGSGFEQIEPSPDYGKNYVPAG
jgi:quercetin dioxygenase-like cupin family protein